MLCDRCKQNVVSSFFTQNINGKVYEYHLCSSCMQKLANINFSLDDILGDFISSSNSQSGFKLEKKRCEKCGFTFDDIVRTGKVGCDNCYRKFREMLLPSIKKLHVNTKHIGKSPASAVSKVSSRILALKEELEVAVKNQEFEQAARIRDEINALKKAGDFKDE